MDEARDKTARMGAPSPRAASVAVSVPANEAPPLVTLRPPLDVRPGAMIGEKYRIEREIGRGGFGIVVRAMHLALDQRVAIKVLTEGEGSTEQEWKEDAARFRLEAQATAALRSPHVVRVVDADVLDGGYPFIVMEYLEGKTLHDLVYGAREPMTVTDAVDVMVQVLAALANAHAAGIVHRDLKPANVFLTTGPSGIPLVKVLDFGVSKMLGPSSQRLTRTGAVVGTVAYMAPEQMLDARAVDGRADIWSVGLVLYEALARQHPFGTSTSGPKMITAVLNEPLVPLRERRPDVPPALETAVAKLLEKKPAQRYATVVDAALALAPFASDRSRPALDEIYRTKPATGAAVPPPPPASTRDVVPSSSRQPRPPAKTTSTAVGLLITLVTALITLLTISAYVYWLKPRLKR